MTTIRRLIATLALALALAAPLAAAPARGSEAMPPAALAEQLHAWLGDLWARIAGRGTTPGDQGSGIDPNGVQATGEIGSTIDPNGAEGDQGSGIDPNG